jgi:hypothetical protein
MSSFGEQWAEEAQVHVSRNFQRQKFFGEYDNVEAGFIGGLSDMQALAYTVPDIPDKDTFLQFCKRVDVIPTTCPQDEKYNIKWNEPIHGTGFSMATKVPPEIFKISLRSTYTPPPNQHFVQLFVEKLKQSYRKVIVLREFSSSIIERVLCGILYLILLPTGLWVFKVLTCALSDAAESFRSSSSLFRISLDHVASKMVHLSKQELILMQTAWQDIQLGRPVVEDEPDLISKSKLGELATHSFDLGFWGAVLSVGGLMLCPAAYGGLHLLGWNAAFSSDVEQQIWRLSSIVVMVGLEVIILPLVLASALTPLLDRFDQDIKGGMANPLPQVKMSWLGIFWKPSLTHLLLLGRIVAFILWVLAVNVASVSMLAYLLARGYLVVDSVVNLWHLPAGVYDTPNWSIYFPHIS